MLTKNTPIRIPPHKITDKLEHSNTTTTTISKLDSKKQEFCSGGDGIWMISLHFVVEKPTELKRVTKQQLDSQDLFFWLDGFQGDRICDTPCTNC